MKMSHWARIAGWSALAVFLVAGIGFPQAGPAGKPVPIKWKITIPDTSTNLRPYPEGTAYTGGVDGINITSGTVSCAGNDKTYLSYLNFGLVGPSQISFQNLYLDPLGGQDSSLNICKFPTGEGSGWPSCLADFLSQGQPWPGYEGVFFTFSTCACGNILSTDFTQMPVGTILSMDMRFDIRAGNISGADCSECNPVALHRVAGRAHGYSVPGLGPDIYISRDSASVWTIRVKTFFDNPARQGSYPAVVQDDSMFANDHVIEEYCVCVPVQVNKRTLYRTQMRYPAVTKILPFDFQLTLTKIN